MKGKSVLLAVLLTVFCGAGAGAYEVVTTDGCNDGFALYVSPVSERASAKDARLSDPVDSLKPLVGYCHRRGFGISKVTPEALDELRRYKVVFLSGLCAVADAEAAALLDYAKNGGVLIADTDVAVLDERSAPRQSNPLKDLFGDVLLDYLDEAGARTVSLEQPEFLPFGQGGAVRLGFPLAAALRSRREEAVDAYLDELLQLRGISPLATCAGLGPDGVFRARRQGDFVLVGLVTTDASLGKPVGIDFRQDGYVYECGKGPVGKGTQVELSALDRTRKLYAQFADEQSAPSVCLNHDALAPGQDLILETTPLRAKSPYGLEVVLPGDKPSVITKPFAASGAPVSCQIPPSAAVGDCTVRVKDVMTGLVGERKLTVRKLRPVPRKAMRARLESGDGLGALVSFGPDAADGFNPSSLDAGRIVGLCKEAGVGTLTLAVKLRNGFCLWPTRTSDRSVADSLWKDGRGDVVREFADACRQGGLGFGICVSHEDLGVDWYPAPWRDQWRELASGGYGPLSVGRFARAEADDELVALTEELKERNRDMVFVGGGSAGDLRLMGPGDEVCDPNARCGFRATGDPQTPGWGGVAKGDVDGSLFLQPCCDAAPDSPTALLRKYFRCVGNGAAMEIGLVLGKDGSLPPDAATALKLFGKLRTAFFAEKVAEGAFDAGSDSVGIDRDRDFNLIVLREDLSKGEQIDGWELWLDQADGASEKLLSGVSVGVRRFRLLERMARGARLRFVVTSSAGDPQDVSFGLYRVQGLPSFTKK